MCPDRRPPRTRMVVSNTCGLVLTSKETHSMTFLTAVSKPCRSSRTTSVSSTSMSVREKLPATSLAAIFLLQIWNYSDGRPLSPKMITHGFAQSGPCPVHERGVNWTVHKTNNILLTFLMAHLVHGKRYCILGWSVPVDLGWDTNHKSYSGQTHDTRVHESSLYKHELWVRDWRHGQQNTPDSQFSLSRPSCALNRSRRRRLAIREPLGAMKNSYQSNKGIFRPIFSPAHGGRNGGMKSSHPDSAGWVVVADYKLGKYDRDLSKWGTWDSSRWHNLIIILRWHKNSVI